MAITVQTIVDKQFKTKSHGYDEEEVNKFLDEIADEFEVMEREIKTLREAARQPVAPAPAPLAAPAPVFVKEAAPAPETDTIKIMLETARRVSDETQLEAKRQADLILSDAKTQAKQLVDEAKAESDRLKDSLDVLRSAATDYRARFKRLVDDQVQVLNTDTDLFK
ncbi:septum site-determining protein DivIVA [Clostridia bacterium]|nr:septum site-determining protein DivIVA [Clostridia bacterium]